MKTITKLLLSVVLAMGFAGSAFAQLAVVRTTLTGAVSSPNQTVIAVSSATGFLANTSSTQYYILIDNELMSPRSISGTNITVTRSQSATNAAPHSNGSTVIWGPVGTWATQSGNASGVFIGSTPQGGCVRNQNTYLPVINVGQRVWYNCLGGVWLAQSQLDVSVPALRVCNVKTSGIALVSIGANAIPGTAGNFYYSTFFNPSTRAINSIQALFGVTVGSAAGFQMGIYEWNTVTSGGLLFNTSTAGATFGTASTFLGAAVGTPGILTGPATYMFYIQAGGTTDGLNLLPVTPDILSTLRAGTFGTLPATVAAATGSVASTGVPQCYN